VAGRTPTLEDAPPGGGVAVAAGDLRQRGPAAGREAGDDESKREREPP
jgi:hypothetical protein